MAANIHELLVAFSKTAQTAIDVASEDLVRFTSLSNDIADVDPVVEDDADEIGKGNEFAEESFLVAWKVSKKWECYLSAEALAIAAAFGLGSGSAGVYTPIDPITDANQIELPWMTLVETIRPGSATEVFNRALLGLVVNKFSIALAKGAGRANAKLTMELMGSGLFQDPTTLTMPARTPVHLLPAASLTCTINGIDYTAEKTFESFDLAWDNNVRDGFYPGSGFQTTGDPTSGQVQGRMEFGKRQLTASFTARFQNGSTELTKLTAQTAGTASLGLTGATGYDALMEFPQVTFKTAKVANENGIVTVKTDLSAQYDGTALSTGGLVKFTVNNTLGTVGRV